MIEHRRVSIVGLLFTGVVSSAAAATFSFDEFGNGIGFGPGVRVAPGGTVSLPGTLTFDPGPGGLSNAFTYSLGNPLSLVAGDVFLFEPGTGNALSDVIRFNSAGTGGNPAYLASVIFYSDTFDVDEQVSPADTGFPIALYSNTVNLRESFLSPGVEGAVYTPFAGQPGSLAGFDVTYVLISDTPEPASLGFCFIGALALGGIKLVTRTRKQAA